MIGQVLGGRYEILDRVGGGGMALVYKGYDLLLHRNVAVKILRQQYVHDEEFIRRFRREAQSAASLSHPNVVSMYDVGQEEDTHFIVMEYVEGMTLNDLIKEKAPLQVEDALHIATQICDALEHAHNNHIIHRDIKPHNILIGKNGRIKVTDFGIARAATSSTITQTGSVIGSVHYFSPEHAKGVAAGAKSDLYSLGIVLYQMLTARLPFLGESPISVALKHLQEDVEDPRLVNPLIPQSVENIILKAMRKNPEERYQSAAEMLRDLETALDPGRRNEPKLSFLDDDLDEERTRVIPAIRGDKPAAHEDEEEEPVKPSGGRRKKKNLWVAPLVWTGIFVVFLAVMWFGVIPAFKDRIIPDDVPVPTVVDMHIEDAKRVLEEHKLEADIKYDYSDKVEKDYVISQVPQGMKKKEGSLVSLRVSKGAELQLMEDYRNLKWKDVKAELLAAGFRQEQLIEQFSHIDTPEDTIISHVPEAGGEFDPVNGTLTFVISKGREKVTMPDLINRTVKEAEARLLAEGLKLAPGDQGKEWVPSFDYPADRIVDTYPFKAGESADPNVELKLFISSGPPKDAVETVRSIKLESEKEGEASLFRIVVSDVRNDNREENKEVITSDIINVRVTVTPTRNALIEIFRKDRLYQTLTVTYQDYLNQKSPPSPTPKPTESPAPDPTVEAEVSPRANSSDEEELPSPTPAGG